MSITAATLLVTGQIVAKIMTALPVNIPKQSQLASRRFSRNAEASSGQREGEFMRVASIPTAVVEKWMREGFNILTMGTLTGADIVKRLKAENLDAFLTTDKSILAEKKYKKVVRNPKTRRKKTVRYGASYSIAPSTSAAIATAPEAQGR